MSPPPIDADLVRRLVQSQFPQWANRRVTAVEPGGWDNRTFRLGDDLLARLPSSDAYAAQVARESEWLPRLAPMLPLPIPSVLAEGRPTADFPRPWSIRPWLPGAPPGPEHADDPRLARRLAGFLNVLHDLPAMGGPPPGRDNFHRGGPLEALSRQTTEAITTTQQGPQADQLKTQWQHAMEQPPPPDPTWLHGDIAPSNLLVTDDQLTAVIDFGCCAVGDPAGDLVVAWTYFRGEARAAFRAAIDADPAAWGRARGWAMWKALVTLVEHPDPAAAARRFGWSAPPEAVLRMD